MQLKVIQSCQDKVSLGTTSVGSMISPQFRVSEASNESQDLWVPPEELGIHPKGFLDYKPIMCFFHADIHKILSCNMHKLSFKLIIKRGLWICILHSFHWPTDLDSSAGSRTLTRNRYKKKLHTRHHDVLPADLQGTEEQSSITLPIDFCNKLVRPLSISHAPFLFPQFPKSQ